MRARLPVVGTTALGLAALAVAAVKALDTGAAALALFAAAVIVCELVEDDSRRSREPTETQPFRLASALHVAAVVVVGAWPGALVAGVGALVVQPLRGRRIRHAAFEAAAVTLAALAGGYAFTLAGAKVGHLALLDDLVPLAALALAYLTVRTALLELVLAREPFHPDLWNAAGEAGLGAIVALLAIAHPWNLVAVVPLGIVIHGAQARLSRVRRETLHALETFANIVDERDPSTYQHSVRVARHVDALARALHLPFSDVDRLRWAARLHDLGKVAVDAAVLRKPGRLDRADWAAVHRHPRLSARLLQRFEFAANQARAVEFHHERYDGRGYYGVDGRDLPLASHFLIVADSFDAMRTDRPFRRALTRDEALAEIERNVGTQFHPTIAKAFVALQRGQDPERVLSPDELAEVRDATLPYRLPDVPGAGDFRERPELLVLGGVALALVGGGVGASWLLAFGLAVGATGLALRSVRLFRVRRLSRSLVRVLAGCADRNAAFDGVTALLARASDLTWSALVSWQEDRLGGSIEREWGSGAPSETALMSWLVREAESGEELLRASADELRGDGALVALPLHRDNSALVGFLVLAAPRQLRGHVEHALRSLVDQLGLALAERPIDPGRTTTEAVAAAS
jgi:putative nucleotidyltransferase with HDIG domain